MAKKVTKTKKMSEAVKPSIKTPPKKATPKKTVVKKTTTKKVTPKTEPKVKTPPKKRVTASNSRKRTTPKKVVLKPVVSPKPDANLKVVKAVSKNKNRTIDSNLFIKVSTNSKDTKFVEMGNKVQRGEVKWMYFTTENNIGYHYYLKLK